MIYNYMDLSIHIGKGVQMTEEVLLGYVSVCSLPRCYGLAGLNTSLLHSSLQTHSILRFVMLVRK
jgi:hypothetical protein